MIAKRHIQMACCFVLGFCVVFSLEGAVVARWNFNNFEDANPETGTLVANEGAATCGTSGGVSQSFGVVGGGASDPEESDDSQVRLGRFAARDAANKTAGIQFMLSTVGYENIRLNWDQYNSATASRYWRVQYTLDGRAWNDHALFVN